MRTTILAVGFGTKTISPICFRIFPMFSHLIIFRTDRVSDSTTPESGFQTQPFNDGDEARALSSGRSNGRVPSLEDHTGHPHPHFQHVFKLVEARHVIIDHVVRGFYICECLKVGMGVSCVVPVCRLSFS